METLRLHGTPHKLDVYLRPAVRGLLLVGALALTLLLLLLSLWWWLPVPLALAFAAYELFFWWRGDRRCTLELGESIRWVDRLRGEERVLDPTTIQVATLVWRPAQARHLVMARLVLGDDRGVVLALRLQLRTPFEPEATDLTGLFLDAVVGAGAGPVHHLAPHAAIGRQVVYDPHGEGLRWFREHLPPEAWQRIAVRVWQGRAPRLDLLGTHEGAPDGWLVLDGRQVRLRLGREERAVPLVPGPGGQAERPATFVDMEGGKQHVDLPMVMLELGAGVTLACPSPLVGTLGEARELDEHTLHTHAAEGELVVWHLLTHTDRAEWAENLVQAVEEARVEGELPEALRR